MRKRKLSVCLRVCVFVSVGVSRNGVESYLSNLFCLLRIYKLISLHVLVVVWVGALVGNGGCGRCGNNKVKVGWCGNGVVMVYCSRCYCCHDGILIV